MTSALNLQALFTENEGVSFKGELHHELSRRFIKLFPKPKEVVEGEERFFFSLFKRKKTRLEYPIISKVEIKEILIKNELVSDVADPEEAVNEAINRRYQTGYYEASFYKFDGIGADKYLLLRYGWRD